jgi:hypothetical protein
MSNKIKISFGNEFISAREKPVVEKFLRELMNWVQITDTEWIVLTNRYTTEKLHAKLKKMLSNVKIETKDVRRKKIALEYGYIDAKNDELSEILLTTRY